MGGVGRYPYSMFGANCDALIALLDGPIRSWINRAAARTPKVNDSAIKSNIARQVLQSGIYKRGEEWLDDPSNKDEIRLLREKQAQISTHALEESYLPTPKYNYLNLVQDQIFFSLRDTPNLTIFEYQDRAINAQLIRGLSKVSDTGRDYLSENFRWLGKLRVDYHGLIDPIHNKVPFLALSPQAKSVYQYMGVSNNSHGSSIELQKIFGSITSDPYFPPYIRAEDIVDAITNPKIIQNLDAMTNTLLSMGCSTTAATKIVTTMEGKIEQLMFFSNSKSFSINDYHLINCDNSKINSDRLCDKPIITNVFVERILSDLGLMLFALQPSFEQLDRPKRVRIKGLGDVTLFMQRELSDFLYNPISEYQQLFKNDEWM